MAKEKVCTWDSLITKYIIEKTKRGYEPNCTSEEIVNFLDFINSFVAVNCPDINYNEVLENYLNGPGSKRKDWSIRNEIFVDIPIVEKLDSGLIVPTYNLRYTTPKYDDSDYEKKDYDEKFNEYLNKYMKKNCLKRTPITNETLDDETVQFGENVAATLLIQIWNSRINHYQEDEKWPIQCKDIKENLLDRDLSSIIGLSPMREELINFYFTISDRIMNEAQGNYNFRITNFEDEILAKSNFDLIMDGYINFSYYRTVNKNQSGIIIDRCKNEFQTVTDWYEGNIKNDTLDNPKVLKLVRDLKNVKQK